MCKGDDISCPHFELHYNKLKQDLNAERRGFLKGGLFAASGLATLGAGGISLVTPALAQATTSKQPAQRAYHYLPANAETVHWGYFSKSLKPRIEVNSGDIVTIESLTHHAGDDLERMVDGDEGAESVYLWTKEKKGVDRRGAGPTDPAKYKKGSGEGQGVHIMTGPVYVRHAEPGDILEVRILDCGPRPSGNPKFSGKSYGSNAAANWGFHYNDLLGGTKREVVTIYEVDVAGGKSWAKAVYNFQWVPQTDPFGVRHDTIDYPGVPVDHSLTKRNYDVLKGVRLPIRPHFGTIGLAPKEADVVDTIPPSYTGGNIDNWRIRKGATMYYPVSVDGALLSVGDPHASQGDSELCGTAIECSLTGTFQLILHKKADLAGTPLEELNYPMLETQTDWLVHGFSYANYLEELGPSLRATSIRSRLSTERCAMRSGRCATSS